jgi:hypothetical protein
MFEVQVQGKFKREPIGEVFVGAETVQKLELGLLTRSISNAAMRLASTMAQDLHYHFGDSPNDPNYQLPHVVAPMFTTFDKVHDLVNLFYFAYLNMLDHCYPTWRASPSIGQAFH